MEPKNCKNYELNFSLDGIEDLGGGDMPAKQEPQKPEEPENIPTYLELLVEHGRVEALRSYIVQYWDLIEPETCLNMLGMSLLDEDD